MKNSRHGKARLTPRRGAKLDGARQSINQQGKRDLKVMDCRRQAPLVHGLPVGAGQLQLLAGRTRYDREVAISKRLFTHFTSPTSLHPLHGKGQWLGKAGTIFTGKQTFERNVRQLTFQKQFYSFWKVYWAIIVQHILIFQTLFERTRPECDATAWNAANRKIRQAPNNDVRLPRADHATWLFWQVKCTVCLFLVILARGSTLTGLNYTYMLFIHHWQNNFHHYTFFHHYNFFTLRNL